MGRLSDAIAKKEEGKKKSLREAIKRREERLAAQYAGEIEASRKPSFADRALANAPGRLVTGMAKSAILGPFQAGAFLGDAIRAPVQSALGIEQHESTRGVPEVIQSLYKELDESQKRGGFEGTDVAGFLGQALGVLPAAPSTAGKTFLRRRAVDAMFGGGMGAMAPVEGEDGISTRLANTLFGGVLAPALGGVADAAPAVGRFAREAKQIGIKAAFQEHAKQKAIKAMLDAVDDGKLDKVLLQMEKGEIPIGRPTPGQLAANAGDTGLPGLESKAMAASGKYKTRMNQQSLGREAALRTYGGSQKAINQAEATREAITAPMRTSALERADIAATVPRLQEEAAQQMGIIDDALHDKAFIEEVLETVSSYGDDALSPQAAQGAGEMLASSADEIARASQLVAAKMAKVQELTKLGNKPLVVDNIANAIGRAMKLPKAAGKNTQTALRSMSDHLRGLADENGVIPAEALYQVRKTADDFVTDALKGTKSDRAATAAITKQIKGVLDDAIEEASGGGWRDYIETYAQMSHVIDSMRVMEGFRKTLVPPANDIVFASAGKPVRAAKAQNTESFLKAHRDPAKFANRVLGGPRVKIDQVLSKEQLAALDRVAKSAAADVNFKDLAATGARDASDVVGKPVIIPRTLNFVIAMGNRVSEFLQGKLGQAATQELEKLILAEPRTVARMLKQISPAQRKALMGSKLGRQVMTSLAPAMAAQED